MIFRLTQFFPSIYCFSSFVRSFVHWIVRFSVFFFGNFDQKPQIVARESSSSSFSSSLLSLPHAPIAEIVAPNRNRYTGKRMPKESSSIDELQQKCHRWYILFMDLQYFSSYFGVVNGYYTCLPLAMGKFNTSYNHLNE